MPPSSLQPEEHRALGESDAFLSVQERISRAARTNRPVILLGERGTGKELAASRLHLLSARWGQPYVTLNCASLSESLIESELFGHEAGAFTGAVRLRKGRFEYADGGTLFLDEIATLPLPVQEKLLRVVEYGQMERVGSSRTMKTDARLIAATNVDLCALARQGRFRQDLLDRLSFEVIVLPPLRRRRDDILLLASFFARQMAGEMGLSFAPEFSPRTRRLLLDHPWPGNVRELKNVVERMVYRTPEPLIDDVVFDPFDFDPAMFVPMDAPGAPLRPAAALAGPASPSGDSPGDPAGGGDGFPHSDLQCLPLTESVRALELWRIRRALAESRFNQRKAAARLGLTVDQLRTCLRKYRQDLDLAPKA